MLARREGQRDGIRSGGSRAVRGEGFRSTVRELKPKRSKESLPSLHNGVSLQSAECGVGMMIGLSDVARRALGNVEYRDQRAVLLFADSARGLDRCRRAAAAAGCRVGGGGSLLQARERLRLQVSVDAVLVDIERDPGAELDSLLERFGEAADADRYGSVIAAPAALRQRFAATPLPAGVHCLFEPSGFDRLVALQAALVRQVPCLNDVKGQGTPRLHQLSEEVARIANALASLADEEMSTAEDEEGNLQIDAALVRSIIRARRLRDHFFKSDLFADPAWDMLLDLYAARLEERPVAVSSLCIAAAVPPTTALRWIKSLCDQGLFVRTADPEDGRRVFIKLADGAAAGLEKYLRAAHRVSPVIV